MSELEHVVLGIVWTEQPCTAYAVRRVFQESPSSHFSGSAGAIYPLMRRLERRGLLRSRARRGDGRASRVYRLAAGGLAELRKWLQPPLPPGSALMDIDPLRLKVRFLGALGEQQRRFFIEEARAKLREQLESMKIDARRDAVRNDIYCHLVARGAILSVRAQLAWLREVQATFKVR